MTHELFRAMLVGAFVLAVTACGDGGGATDGGADGGDTDTDADTDTDTDADAGADGSTDTETLVDPAVAATITVGQQPRTIAVSDDDAFVYVPNTQSGNVSVIETAGNTVGDTLTVGPQPFAAALTPDGAWLFVTQGLDTGGGITIIDTATGEVAQALTDALDGGRGIAFSPDGGLAFACSHWDGRLKAFDVDAVIADPSTPPVEDLATGTSPVMIAVTADGGTVYVGNAEGASISIFDTSDWSSHSINLPPGAAPVGLALGSSDTRLYIADKSGGLLVFDTIGETLLDFVPIAADTVGVAVSPNGGWIWVVVQSENRVVIIDPGSLEIAAEVDVGASPFAMCFSHDATRAYVSNMGEGTVSVIETNDYR